MSRRPPRPHVQRMAWLISSVETMPLEECSALPSPSPARQLFPLHQAGSAHRHAAAVPQNCPWGHSGPAGATASLLTTLVPGACPLPPTLSSQVHPSPHPRHSVETTLVRTRDSLGGSCGPFSGLTLPGCSVVACGSGGCHSFLRDRFVRVLSRTSDCPVVLSPQRPFQVLRLHPPITMGLCPDGTPSCSSVTHFHASAVTRLLSNMVPPPCSFCSGSCVHSP